MWINARSRDFEPIPHASLSIRQAIENYKSSCIGGMSPSKEQLLDIVTAICDFFLSPGPNEPSSDVKKPTLHDLDPTHCPCCRYVLVEPVTLCCGHTLCTRCLSTDHNQFRCYKCNAPVSEQFISNSKVNIVINNICHTFWTLSIEKAKNRNETLDLFERQIGLGTTTSSTSTVDQINNFLSQLVISDKTQDNECFPDDFDPLRTSYVSKLKCLVGDLKTAKALANNLISSLPDCYMGYLRLAEACESTDDVENAIICYFQALIRSPSLKLEHEVKDAIVNILEKVLLPEKYRKEERCSSPKSDIPCCSKMQSFQDNFKSMLCDSAGYSNQHVDAFVNVIDKVLTAGESTSSIQNNQLPRLIDSNKVDLKDFECSLCCRIFWEPVTTSCGHTFCLSCLERLLDYGTKCPLCKQSIQDILNCEKPVTEFLDVLIQRNFPYLYEERKKLFAEEMNNFRTCIEDGSKLPVFVCTNAFPTVPCPLHIYEPRYKLMLRRCIKSQVNKFGMCFANNGTGSSSSSSERFSLFGTILSIKQVNLLPDGRAILQTVGLNRFKVVDSELRDGYNVASVEWLADHKPPHEELESLLALHANIRMEVQEWIDNLDDMTRSRITNFLGSMPEVEEDYYLLADGPCWLWWTISVLPISQKIHTSLIGTTSLKKRLLLVQKVMQMVRVSPPIPS